MYLSLYLFDDNDNDDDDDNDEEDEEEGDLDLDDMDSPYDPRDGRPSSISDRRTNDKDADDDVTFEAEPEAGPCLCSILLFVGRCPLLEGRIFSRLEE